MLETHDVDESLAQKRNCNCTLLYSAISVLTSYVAIVSQIVKVKFVQYSCFSDTKVVLKNDLIKCSEPPYIL